MPNDEDFQKFGITLADQLLPVIEADVSSQVELRFAATEETRAAEIAALQSEQVKGVENVQQTIIEVEKSIRSDISSRAESLKNDVDGVQRNVDVGYTHLFSKIETTDENLKTISEKLHETQKSIEAEASIRIETLATFKTSTLDEVQRNVDGAYTNLVSKIETADENVKTISEALRETQKAIEAEASTRTEVLATFKASTLEAVTRFQDEATNKFTQFEEALFAQNEGSAFQIDAIKADVSANVDTLKQLEDTTYELKNVDAVVISRIDSAEADLKMQAARVDTAVAAFEKIQSENVELREALSQLQLEVVALRAKAAEPVDHSEAIERGVTEQIGRLRAELSLEVITGLQKAADRLPVPKDGNNGRDGKFIDPVMYVENKDYPYQSMVRHAGGMWYALRDTSTGPGSPDWQLVSDGVQDVTVEYKDLRNFEFKVIRSSGDTQTFSFEIPVPLYKGVFSSNAVYGKGDIITYDGSTWIATRAPDGSKPKESDAWVLQTKRGSDGKVITARDHVRGEYKEDEAYEKGDLVDYGGYLWMARRQNHAAPPINALKSNSTWALVA